MKNFITIALLLACSTSLMYGMDGNDEAMPAWIDHVAAPLMKYENLSLAEAEEMNQRALDFLSNATREEIIEKGQRDIAAFKQLSPKSQKRLHAMALANIKNMPAGAYDKAISAVTNNKRLLQGK